MMFFAIASAPPWSRHAGANLAVNGHALNAGMLVISVDRKRFDSAPPEFCASFEEQKIKPPSHEAGRFDNFAGAQCERLISA